MMELLKDYSRYVNKGWISTLDALAESPVFIRAEDDALYDNLGNKWFDFIGHYGATLFGHNHRLLTDSLVSALGLQYPIGAPLGITDVPSKLAKTLINRLDLDGDWKNWTLTTGAEAVEAAIKLSLFSTGKRKILTRRNGFHGLSQLTLQLSDNAFWRSGFQLLIDTENVDYFDDIDEALLLLREENYSALIVEPIQAIGGGGAVSNEDALSLRHACSMSNTVFIVDEVFTGMGRCGHYSAMQSLGWSVAPDIVILSKTLTAGLLPSAQLLVRQKLFDDFTERPGCAKLLASTFAGNSLGQILALKVVSLLDEHFSSVGFDYKPEYISQKIIALSTNYPEQLKKVSSYAHTHFLTFQSKETALVVWQYLYANRVLALICSHQPDTLKLICSISQSNDSIELLFDVIRHVFEEVQV